MTNTRELGLCGARRVRRMLSCSAGQRCRAATGNAFCLGVIADFECVSAWLIFLAGSKLWTVACLLSLAVACCLASRSLESTLARSSGKAVPASESLTSSVRACKRLPAQAVVHSDPCRARGRHDLQCLCSLIHLRCADAP